MKIFILLLLCNFMFIVNNVVQAAPTGIGGASGYTCGTDNGDRGGEECGCYDYLDCKELLKSGNCDGDLTPLPGDDGGDTYICKWKYKVDPDNSHGYVKPALNNAPGFIAPPSEETGSTRRPTMPVAPINKSLVTPIVVPTIKTNTRPTVLQPKLRTMSTPSISIKQRVESPIKNKTKSAIKNKADVPAPASSSQNKPSRKPIIPAKSNEMNRKTLQPSVSEINKEKQKAGATMKHFDEADAIFGKRVEPGMSK